MRQGQILDVHQLQHRLGRRSLMAAEELDGVHEARVERAGPAHPRRPGASLRSAGQERPVRALERASLRREVAASPPGRVVVVATRRRAEPQAEARGRLCAGARVCKEPYLAASFSMRRRAWFCRHRLRHGRCVRGGGWRAYLEGEIRLVPSQHWKIKRNGKSQLARCSYYLNDQMEDGLQLPIANPLLLGIKWSYSSRIKRSPWRGEEAKELYQQWSGWRSKKRKEDTSREREERR